MHKEFINYETRLVFSGVLTLCFTKLLKVVIHNSVDLSLSIRCSKKSDLLNLISIFTILWFLSPIRKFIKCLVLHFTLSSLQNSEKLSFFVVIKTNLCKFHSSSTRIQRIYVSKYWRRVMALHSIHHPSLLLFNSEIQKCIINSKSDKMYSYHVKLHTWYILL